MSAVHLTCPHCQMTLQADASTAGQVVRCKHCLGLLLVSGRPSGAINRLLATFFILLVPLAFLAAGVHWLTHREVSSDRQFAAAQPEIPVNSSQTGSAPDEEQDIPKDRPETLPSPPSPLPPPVKHEPTLPVTPSVDKAQEKKPLEPAPADPAKPDVKPAPKEVAPAKEPGRTPPKVKPSGKAPLPNPPLTEADRKLHFAIQRGLQFLVATQEASGTWSKGSYPVGHAAMPGLALLEGGAARQHPSVQRAALFIRANAPKLDTTYELALGILFLDRLGDPRDVPIIRALALRLIAGQTEQGGWSYRCPLLTPPEELQLVTYLVRNQPRPDPIQPVAHPFLIPLPKDKLAQLDPLLPKNDPYFDPLDPKKKDAFVDPLLILRDPDFANPIIKQPRTQDADPARKPDETKSDSTPSPESAPRVPVPGAKSEKKPAPVDGKDPAPLRQPPKVSPKGGNSPAFPVAAQPNPAVPQDPRKWPRVPDYVANELGTAPVPGKGKGKGKGKGRHIGGDNSNTQFAILGLWAARRHGVPMTLTLNLLDERFRSGQMGNGAWNYQNAPTAGGTAPMTCVGLLGLGVSHGSYREAMMGRTPTPPMIDPAIQKGFDALGTWIGDKDQVRNLYGLWSIERVAVMYHLPTIGSKDWHAWGSEYLLATQKDRGSWQGSYHEAIDTSMAILFLRRANLSQDLTDNLRRFVVVPDQ